MSFNGNNAFLIKVSVKWNANKYSLVADTTKHPSEFKLALQKVTNIPPEKMKLMLKGKLIADSWPTGLVKENAAFLLLASADSVIKPPEERVQFEEDLNEEELALALNIPAGLVNLGNTCYMNATVQCFRAIPELKTALEFVKKPTSMDERHTLAYTFSHLIRDMDGTANAFNPIVFLTALRTVVPHFGETDNHGFRQQDAEECWSLLLNGISAHVPGLNQNMEAIEGQNFVSQFMTGELTSTMTCKEAPEEAPVVTKDTFNKLQVHIGSGVSTYMVSDLTASFTEEIEKNSPTLGRSAVYSKVSRISRLPYYLALSFVRFQWKQAENVRAKILKRVKFPHDLDISSLCVPELAKKFEPAKEHLRKIEEAAVAKKKLKKNPEEEKNADVEMKKPQQEIMAELGIDESLRADIGSNVSGQYDLVAVLTHVGRSTDSGHYIGWVKQEKSNLWWKFDDDKVSQVTAEDIQKLEGGGDWHTAYICLYRAKQL